MTLRSWISQPRWLVFTLLCISAIVLATVRSSQLTLQLMPAEIRFTEQKNFHWNAAEGTLAANGEDPHGFLEIPARCVPLVGVLMEFEGAPPAGRAYIYPSPAHYPGVQLSDATVATGQVENMPGGFRLRFKLPPSRVARFDLPDELRGKLVLRSITFDTRFVGTSNVVFSLLVGSIAGALVLLLWSLFGPAISRNRFAEASCIAALIAGKLWLAGDLQQTIYADAMHDDALFMSQGHSIANGDWLGPFNELTLSKGPTFPAFIALVQLSRIPFLSAEAILHAAGCVILLLALAPVVNTARLRLLLLAVLLFDPHTHSIQVVAQVLRSGIQPALTLLTLAGFAGLAVRMRGRPLLLLPWALLAGVALFFFWFCREEGVWLAPSLAVLTVLALLLGWRAGPHQRPLRIAIVLLPFAIWFVGRAGLRELNHHYYGARITIDVKEGGYPEAYAALTRITPKERIPGVPMTRESRLRAYEVSPAFADLRPSLEGAAGEAWAHNGWEGIDHPSAHKEIRGWFQWALRQAAREAGHYRNAATASAYWHRVADEINAACDNGRLPAGPRRSGFTPQWDSSLWPALFHSLNEAVGVVVRFSDYIPQSSPSAGPPVAIGRFSRMLHEQPVMDRTPPSPRTHVRVLLYRLYAAIGVPLTLIALFTFGALALNAWRQRTDLLQVGLLLAVGGGALSLTAIIALVDATSFSTTHGMYLAPATPLVLVFWILAPGWILNRWWHRLPTLPNFAARLPAYWDSSVRRKFINLRSAALLCFLLSAVCAGVRWQQTNTVIPGRALLFPMVNDMTWDRHAQQVTRTGKDPFGVMELPDSSVPVRQVTAEYEGDFNDVQGQFYVFQYPADLPGNGIDGDSLSQGKIIRRAGGFSVTWELQDSKTVRIDLPDFLDHPLKIREIRIKSTFAWLGSQPFRLMLISTAAGLVCLAFTRRERKAPGRWASAAIAVILVAAKLGIAANVPVSVYGTAMHDDALFVSQAASIMDGKWLGAFNEITLAKGPVYSVFLAAVGASGLRMVLVQTLLHALACGIFVVALRPLISSSYFRLLLLAVLLFDPHSLSAEVVGRPLRSGIHPALTLLALAGFIGLLSRVTAPKKQLLPWGIFAGLAVSAFWYCREEGIWLTASIVLLTGVAAGLIFRARLSHRWQRLGILVLPLAIWWACTWTLRFINWHYYGAPVTMDVKDGNFPRAYGAMVRIDPVENIPLVPVTKESRLRAYPFSPAFVELQPLLEGPIGESWSQHGWEDVDHPAANKEMRGWYQWAIREAAAKAGHYQNARTANEYWGRVADELNAACDRGDIRASGTRSGFFPRWDRGRLGEFGPSWRRSFEITTQAAGFGLHLSRSAANSDQFALFQRVTHEKPYTGHALPNFAERMRLHLFHLYSDLGKWLTPFAALAAVWAAVKAFGRKRHAVEIAVLFALFGGALALITLVAIVETLAFPAVNGSYLSPATPLVLATWVLAPLWAWRISLPSPGPSPVGSANKP